jgi:hypothetical protein
MLGPLPSPTLAQSTRGPPNHESHQHPPTLVVPDRPQREALRNPQLKTPAPRPHHHPRFQFLHQGRTSLTSNRALQIRSSPPRLRINHPAPHRLSPRHRHTQRRLHGGIDRRQAVSHRASLRRLPSRPLRLPPRKRHPTTLQPPRHPRPPEYLRNPRQSEATGRARQYNSLVPPFHVRNRG